MGKYYTIKAPREKGWICLNNPSSPDDLEEALKVLRHGVSKEVRQPRSFLYHKKRRLKVIEKARNLAKRFDF